MTTRQDLISLARHTRDSASLFVKDIGNGLLVVSHNTLALVGLAVVAVLLVFTSQAGLRQKLESATLGWLSARQEARAEAEGSALLVPAEPDAIARATATDPRELSRQQAAVAHWLARRYSVAPEPVSRLVQEAWAVGQRAKAYEDAGRSPRRHCQQSCPNFKECGYYQQTFWLDHGANYLQHAHARAGLPLDARARRFAVVPERSPVPAAGSP